MSEEPRCQAPPQALQVAQVAGAGGRSAAEDPRAVRLGDTHGRRCACHDAPCPPQPSRRAHTAAAAVPSNQADASMDMSTPSPVALSVSAATPAGPA
eukprot:CAMPEP_0206006550 /NCGR_PEP_ID=MMETSP1464-20131121/5243_1 /ASSEMBLY_ACC=CAM_ASM_001124 /TAXON_ID=119497 /ORGANISM="Exanthemachrysis gayraliae, Strain RCC1523" /LENGTH=96 /DNA_ID=CAMNT_0053380031 /DNA_START=96 /DNA_END=383 /DNA_ORIENTATION=-